MPEHPDALEVGSGARRSALQWILAGIGLALLAALVYHAGPRRLAELASRIGIWTPLILVPYALGTIIDAEGWRATFAHTPPSRWLLFRIRLTGEALNNLTPTAYLGGEPVKAYLLRRFGTPLNDGASSVILAKSALTISQILFVILGAVLFVATRGPREIGGLWTLAQMAAGAALVTTLLIRWQRRAPVSALARLGRRFFPRSPHVDRLERRAAEIDIRLSDFYGLRPRAAVASVLFHFVGWFAGAVEISLIMALIGHPIVWSDAIIIEALAQPVRFVGLLIPGTLGVFEAGGLAICAMVGIPQDVGLTMLLMKRLREIAFSLFGLVLLARLRPKSGSAA